MKSNRHVTGLLATLCLILHVIYFTIRKSNKCHRCLSIMLQKYIDISTVRVEIEIYVYSWMSSPEYEWRETCNRLLHVIYRMRYSLVCNNSVQSISSIHSNSTVGFSQFITSYIIITLWETVKLNDCLQFSNFSRFLLDGCDILLIWNKLDGGWDLLNAGNWKEFKA